MSEKPFSHNQADIVSSNDNIGAPGAVPVEPDEELLVAYLDGELSVSEVHSVEERLGKEPYFREKMATLEQTWIMLDALETIPVDKTFVRSTMELVILDAEKEIQEKENRSSKRKVPDIFFSLALFFLIGLIGFQLASLLGIRIVDTFLSDIPVIEKLDQYRQIDDIEFLRELTQSGVFEKQGEGQ